MYISIFAVESQVSASLQHIFCNNFLPTSMHKGYHIMCKMAKVITKTKRESISNSKFSIAIKPPTKKKTHIAASSLTTAFL